MTGHPFESDTASTAEEWQRELETPMVGSVATDEYIFLVRTNPGPGTGMPAATVEALRRSDGQVRWQSRLTGPDFGDGTGEYDVDVRNPVLSGRYVLVPLRYRSLAKDTPTNSGIVALDRTSGESKWLVGTDIVEDIRTRGSVAYLLERGERLRQPHGSYPWDDGPAEGTVVVRALQVSDGESCWSNRISLADDEHVLTPAISGGQYHLPIRRDSGTEIRSFRTDDGTRTERTRLDVIPESGVSAVGERLFGIASAGADDRRHSTFSAAVGDTEVDWIAGAYGGFPPATDGDVVVVRSSEERIAGLDTMTGAMRWENPGTIEWTAPIGPSELLYLSPDHAEVVRARKSDGHVTARYAVDGTVDRLLPARTGLGIAVRAETGQGLLHRDYEA